MKKANRIMGAFDRVYLNLSRDFFENYCNHFPPVNSGYKPVKSVDTIIGEFAKFVKVDELGNCLYDNRSSQTYEGRTKRYIIREANKFLKTLYQNTQANVNMKTFITKTQIDKTLIAIRRGKGKISGHALVFVHAMYLIVRNHPEYNYDIPTEFTIEINRIAENYYRQNNYDEIAWFLVASYAPVCDELLSNGAQIKGHDCFPAIPRKRI